MRFIARPWMPWTMYPWRPMDNREKRARWELAHRAQIPVEPIPWKVTETMRKAARLKMEKYHGTATRHES